MPAGYDIRPWRPGDEKAILALFKHSFGFHLSPEFWGWRFGGHPSGGPLIMLAWSGDRLAAHYGASHAPLVVDGQVVNAALSMTTMTHPDDRGVGLVEKLGEALYDDLRGQDHSAVWGFPNAMIYTTRQRKLGWQAICDVPTMILVLSRARPVTADPGLTAIRLPSIDDRFGRLAAATGRSGTVSGFRDQAVLAWRFADNPVNDYTYWGIEAGPDLAGYAITKSNGNDSTDLVELRAADAAHVTALLVAVRDQALAEGRAQINTWCLNRDASRIAVERFGFAAMAPITYFGGRSFDTALGDMSDARRWRLSMSDSDLY